MNLNGWNFVSATSIVLVNAALASQRGSLIESFNMTTPINANGHYTDWTVVPGGSGKLLKIQIGISDGTMTTSHGPVSLAGVQLVLDVRLDLLNAGSNTQHLKFDLSTVTVGDVHNLPSGMGEITAAEFGSALAQDICSKASQVSFVLASITQPAPGAPAWLAPTSPDFAYVEPAGGSPSIAVFARPVAGAPDDLKLDPGVVGPEGFGAAVSASLFMTNVFQPALIAALGLPAGLAFSQDANGNLHYRGSAGIHSVSAAGETYHPAITSLDAALVDDRVNITFQGNCDLGMNITMSFNGGSSVTLSMTTPGTLSFSSVGNPYFSKDVDIPWYDHLLDIAGGVAEIILQVTVAAIGSELSSGIQDVAGPSALLAEAPNVVTWFSGGGFLVDQAGLSSALWLHGKHS